MQRGEPRPVALDLGVRVSSGLQQFVNNIRAAVRGSRVQRSQAVNRCRARVCSGAQQFADSVEPSPFGGGMQRGEPRPVALDLGVRVCSRQKQQADGIDMPVLSGFVQGCFAEPGSGVNVDSGS